MIKGGFFFWHPNDSTPLGGLTPLRPVCTRIPEGFVLRFFPSSKMAFASGVPIMAMASGCSYPDFIRVPSTEPTLPLQELLQDGNGLIGTDIPMALKKP